MMIATKQWSNNAKTRKPNEHWKLADCSCFAYWTTKIQLNTKVKILLNFRAKNYHFYWNQNLNFSEKLSFQRKNYHPYYMFKLWIFAQKLSFLLYVQNFEFSRQKLSFYKKFKTLNFRAKNIIFTMCSKLWIFVPKLKSINWNKNSNWKMRKSSWIWDFWRFSITVNKKYFGFLGSF